VWCGAVWCGVWVFVCALCECVRFARVKFFQHLSFS
jgi:hypothetical protein